MKCSSQYSVFSSQLKTNADHRIRLATDYWLLTTVLLLFLFHGIQAAQAAERDGRWAILVAGVSGDAELGKAYLKELTDLRAILEGPLGFPKNQIAFLTESPSKQTGAAEYESSREVFGRICRDLAMRIKKEDLIFVFLEGHGDFDGKSYKFNFKGPDSTGEDLALALYSIPARRFIIVNATNCSGGSIPALSRKGTVLITSTKSGMEKNQVHFGQNFIDAFKNNAADLDKNGRVSIMEAFSYARRKIEDYYKNEGSIQTEHPVLDDNGDAKAQADPSPENGEGLLARAAFLDGGIIASAQQNLTAEQQKLAAEARDLEVQIEALKYEKKNIPESDYEKKLEALLLRLAEINAKLPK